MAEGDAIVHNNFKEQLLLGTIDCDTDTFKLALYDTALASPDGAATAYSSTDEIVAANYTATGDAVTVPVVTQDDSNNWGKWDDDGTNHTWSSLGAATILEARLFDTTVSNYLCIMWAIATNSNGGDYTITYGANGIMTLA